MNSDEVYQHLVQIFEKKEIDYKLFEELKQESVSKLKTIYKIYLLEFFSDPEDKKIVIKNKKDFWFLNENVDNLILVYKYIELMIKLIQTKESSSINIYQELEIFINTTIGNKVLYIMSIINKLNLPSNIYLLFIGFILGEKKDFIKKNYIANLQDLLQMIKSDIKNINPNMPITSLDENTLEILNLYFIFKIYKNKNKNTIESFEKALTNSLQNFDLNNYYYKIHKSKLINFLFFEDNDYDYMISKIIKTKVDELIENKKKYIQENIYEYINESSDDEGLLYEESNEEIDDDEEEESEKTTTIMIGNNEKSTIQSFKSIEVNSENKDLIKEGNEISSIENQNNLIVEENKSTSLKEITHSTHIEEDIHKNEESNKINETKQNIKNIINTNEKLRENNESKEKMDESKITNVNYIEKDVGSETSISRSSKTDSFDLKILDQINKYINYPLSSDFAIKGIEQNDYISEKGIYNLTIIGSIINLTESKNKAYNLWNKLVKSIIVLIDKMKSSINFKRIAINNARLEIVVNFLKNPNIINLKRKIIEIMIFHLYSENPNYFKISEDYLPTEKNIKALKELIQAKLDNDKNNIDIKNDLKRLEGEIKNILDETHQKEKEIIEIDFDKKNQLNITKSFLDFYIMSFHPTVHLGKNKSKFYLLPRKMFNTEVKASEYLFDLESILSEEKDNEIIGMENKQTVADLEIYNEKKILSIDEAIKILFSFDSKLTYLKNNAFEKLKNKHKDFENCLNKMQKLFYNIDFKDLNKEDSKDTMIKFSPEIKEQIEQFVETFQKEVLLKISNIIDSLLKGKISESKDIITKIKAFFENYIHNCEFQNNNLQMEEYDNKKYLPYLIQIKTLILEKIIEFFDGINKKCVEFLEEKERTLTELTKSVLSNLRKIKACVEKKNVFGNKYELFVKWASESKFYTNEATLEKIEEYLKKYIKKDLNLEMNYTFDPKFCLWAIKNNFGKYFD